MGEIAVIGEGGMEFEVHEPTQMKITAEGGGTGAAVASSSSVLSWERFLQKMEVSVLLVEADDSTRQIIAALLRKCSYRVAAVPDGFKAWELLNEEAHNIDLILTETELPSISGYALLTLIMEHDICKNIPVIMMSSNDSVSTVYNCMLRGAADFLVKPVRKNELRNLWQHVWRKQASGIGPPTDESTSQEKDSATAENNALSNLSNVYMSSIRINKECNEKGSDMQSSCTKPELGTEIDGENVHRHSQLKRAKQACNDEKGESQPMGKVDDSSTNAWNGGNLTNAITEYNHVLASSSDEAIDLIGTFGISDSNGGTDIDDASPSLDLSLRRSHYNGCAHQIKDEKQRLNHSEASPFSKYISKSLQPHNPMSPNRKDIFENNSKKQLPKYNSEAHDSTMSSLKQISVTSVRIEQHESGQIHRPVPRGLIFEGLIDNAYGSTETSMYHTLSGGPSPLPSPGISQTSESFTQSRTLYTSDSQPSTSQLVDESASHSLTTGCRSNENVNAIPTMKGPQPEFGNEQSFHVHEGSSHRSIQREAALTKFRLKRKDRCFEKKVRYESRKKLAEQRPRIKGQFVRQSPY